MPPAHIKIRPLRSGEGPAVTQLLADVRTEQGMLNVTGIILEDADREIESIYLSSPRARYWVAIDTAATKAPKIIGGVGIQPLATATKYAHVQRMYVRSTYRRQGIARALMKQCIAGAPTLGFRQIYVETLDIFTQAIALYHDLGFSDLEAPLGQSGHGFANCWMQMKLPSA